MNTYIKPSIRIIVTETEPMLAGSFVLQKGTDGADPSSALAPQYNGFDDEDE